MPDTLKLDYAIAPCDFGFMLAAMHGKKLIAASLGDNQAVMRAELQARFPAAQLQQTDPAAIPALHVLTDYLHAPGKVPDIPLELHGTDFQLRVWTALRSIPPGQTRSYTDIARAIGEPAATRAVARACARNPIALLIPCHRVLRSDGGITGYRWGVERKKAIIKHEKAFTESLPPQRPPSPKKKDNP
ncbi:methylated-DNA--[protein]-cysteine S-methyltransferase [Alcaligenes sp. SDU_A2]|uniref:methylated-DNA--[protein]-cysteine S-methyltransferase n=1 Tax=Alcaligenes sp. SDU_A2 TaxID=3136634 RepID=UPI00311F9F3A